MSIVFDPAAQICLDENGLHAMNSGINFDVPVVVFAIPCFSLMQEFYQCIRRLKPISLFLIMDGPSSEESNQQDLHDRAKDVILNIDWDCKVETNFSSYYMGHGRRISSGLDWVFDKVESAIILEADCRPSPEFFQFCRDMLLHFRNDTRIGFIAGTNIAAEYEEFPATYLLSRYSQPWGWATWRRSWKSYDFDLLQLDRVKEAKILPTILGNSKIAELWIDRLNQVRNGSIDEWIHQMFMTSFLNCWLNIVPSVNLVSKIVFELGTATTEVLKETKHLPIRSLAWPVQHPEFFISDLRFDRYFERYELGVDTEYQKESRDLLTSIDSEWPEVMEIGCASAVNVQEFGLHAPETYYDDPLRWTSSVAEWIVPVQGPNTPKHMTIECHGVSPQSGIEARVIINNHEVKRFSINGTGSYQEMSIPDLSNSKLLRILILSTAHMYEGDVRELGIAIKSLKLYR